MLVLTDEYRSSIFISAVSLEPFMPVTFDPDHLRESLRPLVDAQPLSAEARVYQRLRAGSGRARSTGGQPSGRFEVDGFQVVAQVWWPPTPGRRCSVHTASTTIWGCIAMWWTGAGPRVCGDRLRLPGQGCLSGERASIDDFAVYQHVVQGLSPRPKRCNCRNPGTCSGKAPAGRWWWITWLNHGAESPAPGGPSVVTVWCDRVPGVGRKSVLPAAAVRQGIARRFSENTPRSRVQAVS